MGAYIKTGVDYTYTEQESYNYQLDGYIASYEIISKPDKVFCGTHLIHLLANTTIRFHVKKVPNGAETIVDATLLEFLGDSAVINLSSLQGDIWIDKLLSFTALVQDFVNQGGLYIFPNTIDSGSLVCNIAFSQWQYRDTYNQTTPLFSFNFIFDLYPQIVQLDSALIINDILYSEPQFHVAQGLLNTKGSLIDYLSKITLDTNLGNLAPWDLVKYGFIFTPNKNATATTFNGSLANIEYQVAHTYFSGVDNVGEDTTKVTITFDYYDLEDEIQKTKTFICELRLYGIKQLYVYGGIENFVEGAFDSNSFFKTAYDSVGNTITNSLLSIDSNLYNSQTIVITNTDTNVTYTTNDTLPHGHYKIKVSVVVNPNITIQSNEDYFNVYEDTISDIDISSYYTYYRVNQTFSPTSFSVYVKRLIYGNDYYLTRIYYPQYTTNYDGHTFDLDDVPSVDIVFTYVDNNNVSHTKTLSMPIVAPTTDKLFIFDKKTFLSIDYGEVQQGFNFNFVLDQTKDNAKVEVLNHKEEDVKPFTIAYLESTNTWWIVKSDNVTRYDSESVALYKHSLDLIGAIEILNARDLTNCGFNVEHYTIDTFLTRLIKMSDFELPVDIDYGTYLDPNKKVDYLKTFENYSPLSALKEMCNGMNVKPELSFVMLGSTIVKAILTFVPNSGIDTEPIDISVFDDSQEKITNDKENYGSKVVSNVQNCTSGGVIRFPATGTISLSGAEYQITYENACLRLPTKAKEVKELDICTRYVFIIYDSLFPEVNTVIVSNGDAYNDNDIQNTIQSVLDAESLVGFPQEFYDEVNSILVGNNKSVVETIKDISTIRLVNGANYDTQSHEWNGLQVKLAFKGYPDDYESQEPDIGMGGSNSIGLNEKRYYDTFPHQSCIIYWEQGSDLIKNFYFFNPFTEGNTGRTWREENNHKVLVDYNGRYKLIVATGQFDESPFAFNSGFSMAGDWAARYVVHYVPQSDIKVKVENGILDNDTNLYNQNGTLVSGKAVSKLLNSHAVAISSNQISRYKRYYTFSNIPKIGQIVNNNGVKYVINNVSIDFAENDSNLYALDCMFTLTKQIACKSTMISANSVIRDYPTPQNNNIKRIQCYRDYVVLSYNQIANHTSESYLSLQQIFGFFNMQFIMGGNIGYTDNHTALIEVGLDVVSGRGNIYYYQLCAVKYDLNKMFVEVIDFKDNNIIGYCPQNTAHPFTFREWYQHIAYPDQIVVPISYVNSVGELDSINILFVDNEQLTTIYNNLVEDHPDLTRLQSIYSASCVIPFEVFFESSYHNIYDMEIYEQDYDKDGLEIPVFQYSCQINSIEQVEIAENILKGENANENEIYIYRYKVVDNVYLNEENALLYADSKEKILRISKYDLVIYNNIRLSFDATYNKIDMTFYYGVTRNDINISGGSDTLATLDTLNALGKTILIYRNKIDLEEYKVYDNEFVMALNNCNQTGNNGTISINVASYKLK